jgi:hypothetical protein
MGRIAIFMAALLLVATPRATPALAEAAIAVGLPADVAKGGVAIGRAWNYSTKGEAEAEALKRCLAYLDAPAATRALCKVIESFHDQCAAIGIDPKAGTPGIGWAIAADSKTAENQAMAKCLATAGSNRRQFCILLKTSCDGSAK